MSLFYDRPETSYTDTGAGQIAYQQFGNGPDLAYITSTESHVEMIWDHPIPAHYYERLASFSRVLYFDVRGAGASDPIPLGKPPTPESWTDDARAAMDAAAVDRATVVAETEGSWIGMIFAASHPQRTRGLVLVNGSARLVRADDYPIGMPEESRQRLVQSGRAMWGRPGYYDLMLPSRASDDSFKDWLARYQRIVSSPNTQMTMYDDYSRTLDVRSILGSIRVPTLVIGRTDGTFHKIEHSRYLAEHIPDAELLELPGADTHPPFAADPEPVLNAIEEFVTGSRSSPVQDRILATVMFTDIVDSTDHAASSGDKLWSETLERHQHVAHGLLDRYQGRFIKSTGDGILATFDGPTRAVTCASHLRYAVQGMGLDLRIGLHTGEIELADDDISGMSVNIASRVMDMHNAGGIAASSTVRDLVVGSGIQFSSMGSHQLKGVPGEWAIFELESVPG